MQRKGVATKLLEYACADTANDGFEYIEAYTNATLKDASTDYTGPMQMYLKCGFTKIAERGGKVVVQKQLSVEKMGK